MVNYPQTHFDIFPAYLIFNSEARRWSNQPAALTEFMGETNRRNKYDLSNFSMARLTAFIYIFTGAAGAVIAVQYSTDQTIWDYLDGVSGPSVNVGSLGLQVSSYVDIVSAAKTDVFLRIVGSGGNGVAGPEFTIVSLQCIYA